MKLVTKINATVGISILIICVISGLTTYLTTSHLFNVDAKEDLSFRHDVIEEDFTRTKDHITGLAQQFALRPDIIESIQQGKTAILKSAAQVFFKSSGLEAVTIVNKSGVVLTRGHSDKAGDSVMSQKNVQRALSGNPSFGVETGTVVLYSMRAAIPIHSGQEVIGAVVLGKSITTDEFVDSIKKRFNVEFTVFLKEKRMATTLVSNGKRLVGTVMDNKEVIDKVLIKGGVFDSMNTIFGNTYNTVYWPIKDSEGNVTGMFFIGRDREKVQQSMIHFVKVMLISLFLVGVACLVVSSFVGNRIARRIGKVISEVGDCSHQIAGAAEQIAAASQNLAEGSTEQAASLEEASSSLEEISGMAKSNADGASRTTELLSSARTVADAGGTQMEEMSKAMDQINTASNSIAKIIRTIDEIAFQTNILALNAAVEAARAGEAGLGFAVVADEVRNLAQRAAQAAKETQVLIDDSTHRSALGVELNKKVSLSLTEIVNRVRESASIGESSAEAAREESKGVEQINKVISELDKLTQNNAATAEESASASQELNKLAIGLRDAVSALEVMVNGEDTHADFPSSEEAVHENKKSALPKAKTSLLKQSNRD